jgi:hypothetical protein
MQMQVWTEETQLYGLRAPRSRIGASFYWRCTAAEERRPECDEDRALCLPRPLISRCDRWSVIASRSSRDACERRTGPPFGEPVSFNHETITAHRSAIPHSYNATAHDHDSMHHDHDSMNHNHDSKIHNHDPTTHNHGSRRPTQGSTRHDHDSTLHNHDATRCNGDATCYAAFTTVSCRATTDVGDF